jgi:hypothetical protein
MGKKTVFLELPCELIDKIDNMNNIGDRSLFITYLLKKQMENKTFEVDENTEFTTKMRDSATSFTGEIGIVKSDGSSLGKFNINTIEGFEDLARKIEEVSEDPVVRIRARRWL